MVANTRPRIGVHDCKIDDDGEGICQTQEAKSPIPPRSMASKRGAIRRGTWPKTSDEMIPYHNFEGPEIVQNFVQMQLLEIQPNIRRRRNKIFRFMEEGTSRPCASIGAPTAPSFFRKARQRTSDEMIKLRVGATITSQSVPGQNIALVRSKTLGKTNPKEHNGPVPMEGDEEIFEEEAVCKNCFHNLKEENILKTECKCGNALIHEECAAKWSRTRGNNNCDSCGQEVQTFPVTLVRGLSSSTQVVDREESNKWSLFSWLMRIWKA